MQSFDLDLILVPCLVIFFTTMAVALMVTRSVMFSLFAAFAKGGIFLVYFGVLFDGTFTFLDDWSYLEGGQELLAHGVGITNLADNWELALMTGGGDNFVYYLYNTYAFRLFGYGYYAPVALNILLTLLVAWFGTRLAAREFGFSDVWQKWFFAFLLLHPDIMAWSNIMNGKDIFVLLLHVLLMLSCSMLFRHRFVHALALLIPVSLMLLFTRFYVPVLFAVALAANLLIAKNDKGRLRLFIPVGMLVALALAWIGQGALQHFLAQLREQFVNPLYGFVHFALTPIPFKTDVIYSFLDFPALFHWLLFPFTCWGAILVYRLRTQFSIFFLLYLLVFASLYSTYGELQGPRHRVQLDYAWAVLQFIGVMDFLPSLFARQHQALIRPSAESMPTGGYV